MIIEYDYSDPAAIAAQIAMRSKLRTESEGGRSVALSRWKEPEPSGNKPATETVRKPRAKECSESAERRSAAQAEKADAVRQAAESVPGAVNQWDAYARAWLSKPCRTGGEHRLVEIFVTKDGRKRFKCSGCFRSYTESPQMPNFTTRVKRLSKDECLHTDGWRKSGTDAKGTQRFECKACELSTADVGEAMERAKKRSYSGELK